MCCGVKDLWCAPKISQSAVNQAIKFECVRVAKEFYKTPYLVSFHFTTPMYSLVKLFVEKQSIDDTLLPHEHFTRSLPSFHYYGVKNVPPLLAVTSQMVRSSSG